MVDIAEHRRALGIISAEAVTVKAGDTPPERMMSPDAETESDGEVAVMPRAETDAAMADASAGAPFDEDGPVWPSDDAESAFLGGEKSEGRSAPKAVQTLRQAAEAEEAALGPLPALDALIARIPAEARDALEDLFRPKFTGVRRVSKDVLK
jgi:hypothetical protein